MARGKVRKASDMFVWVILVLLIVGLAGFGAVNFGGSIRTIGSVGDTEIPVDRYARALQQELRTLEAQTGRRFTLAEAQAFGLDRAVLQQVVATAALEDEAARLGLSVGDEAVRREVLRVPAFQGLSGSFDREAYEFSLRQNGQSVAQFEASVRADTARTLLQGAVVAGVTTPDVFVDTLYGYARQTRDFAYVTFGPENLDTPLPEPDDTVLQAFYDANPDLFTLPERRRITYAWLTPEMMKDEVEADDDALRALYDERIADYVQPERRLVDRLVFSSEEAAKAALDRITAGEITFDDLIAERGLEDTDVDLGDLSRAQLGAAADIVFAQREPGVVGPAESDLGPALFRVNGILAAQETTFEEARDDLFDEFSDGAARRLVATQIDPVDDLLAGGATLEQVAADTPLVAGEILLSDTSEDTIARYLAFRTAAAAAKVGDFPEVTQLEDGGLFALRLDEIVAPTLQPFDAVKVAVIGAWEQSETARALTAQAEALKATVEGGGGLYGGPIAPVTQSGVLRDAFMEGAPEQLVVQVFEMQSGELRVIDGDSGAVLVRLDAVNAADTAAPQSVAIRDGFAKQTAQDYGRDMIDAFTQATETRAGIQLNQTAINAVHAQFP